MLMSWRIFTTGSGFQSRYRLGVSITTLNMKRGACNCRPWHKYIRPRHRNPPFGPHICLLLSMVRTTSATCLAEVCVCILCIGQVVGSLPFVSLSLSPSGLEEKRERAFIPTQPLIASSIQGAFGSIQRARHSPAHGIPFFFLYVLGRRS